jgi:hypothetical protein
MEYLLFAADASLRIHESVEAWLSRAWHLITLNARPLLVAGIRRSVRWPTEPGDRLECADYVTHMRRGSRFRQHG